MAALLVRTRLTPCRPGPRPRAEAPGCTRQAPVHGPDPVPGNRVKFLKSPREEKSGVGFSL